MTLEERFWAKVQKAGDDECWLWTAALDKDGYGRIALGARHLGWRPAHIVAYTLTHGSIPEGLVLDHGCTNTSCVNPNHLEAVTSKINTLRGQGPTAVNARKTHCSKNHEYTSDNTYWSPTTYGWRRSCCICTKRRPKGKKDWLR